MGVWIETVKTEQQSSKEIVTPCVGVWIETSSPKRNRKPGKSHPAWVCGLKPLLQIHRGINIGSHPAWVCGLKQNAYKEMQDAINVTPCVGVWIETRKQIIQKADFMSHPAWVCGLKHDLCARLFDIYSHTLRGCVD